MSESSEALVLGFPVDHDLSEEKLRFLLAQRSERAELDCKVSFDMSNKGATAEFTKDYLAIAHTKGGYLLLGVDKQLKPVGLTKKQCEQIDGSALIEKVKSYCPSQDVKLLLAKHEMDLDGETKRFVLVYIPKSHVLLIPVKDGVYRDQHGKEQVAFRAGDLLVRHDDRSERMQPQDFFRFLDEAVEREKEHWMGEVAKIVDSATQAATEVQRLSEQQVSEAMLWLDGETFRGLVISYLGSGNAVAARELAMTAASSAARAWSECEGKDRNEAEDFLTSRFDPVLDKLFLMSVAAIDHDQNYLLNETLRAFARLYTLAASDEILKTEPSSTADLLWIHPSKAVMLRCYALGTYAILQEKFASVWQMADRRVRLASGQEEYLLQDVFLNRRRGAEQFAHFENTPSYLTERADMLRLLPKESEHCSVAVLDFDLLVCYLLWLRKSPRVNLFTSRFAFRTAPFISKIISHKESIAGPGYEDRNFACFLHSVEKDFGWSFGRWEVSELPRDIQDFLTKHPKRDNP